MNWANHRWLRLRSFLAALEEVLLRFELACAHPEPPDPGYQQWVESLPLGAEPSYRWVDRNQRQLAIQVIAQLRSLAEEIQRDPAKLETDAPRPRPELRPKPRL